MHALRTPLRAPFRTHLRVAHQLLLVGFLAMTGLLACRTPPAAAVPGDTAHLRSGPIAAFADPTNAAPRCVSTTITLGAGTYHWGAGTNDQDGQDPVRRLDRTYRLGAGSYDWKVCLDPNEGHYVMFTELDPSYGAWHTVRLVSPGFELPTRYTTIYSYLDPIVLDQP